MIFVYTLLIIAIIFLATLENLWPLLVGLQQTPVGYVFLGTVHHPADYFYYLSQFTQGAYRTITTVDLYTSEVIPPSFVGWSNVALGKLFFLLGFSPGAAYHISVLFLTVLIFIAAYRLSLHIFKSRPFALLSLYFFALFHAFPMTRDGVPSYGDYWNNFAVPRVRLGAVPHQLLLTLSSFLMVYGIFRWRHTSSSWKTLILIACSSVILGSLQPALWGLIAGSIGITYLIQFSSTTPVPRGTLIKGIGAVGLGAIPVLYLAILFRSLPFSQLQRWEATQQTPLTPEHFLTATGPLFLLGLFSLPALLSKRTFEQVFLFVFSVISFGLFLSPIPSMLGISHVRCMSALAILSVTCIAVFGVQGLIRKKTPWVTMLGYLIIAALSVLLIPNHFKTLKLATGFNPNNLYHYLPKEEYELFQNAASMTRPNETFLVVQPYNELFPAISGRRSYSGHPLLTINAAQKEAFTRSFFSDTLQNTAMHQFLTDQGIRWIISTPNQHTLKTANWAIERAKTNSLILYEVQK